MHDGMFFEPDQKLTALCNTPVWTVEHFRKGFADRPGTEPRRVPAVTGALMVFDRRFGRELGLFDEDFVWGHYEDADLCLRAWAAEGAVTVDPLLAFWHYEGKGSVKRPEHTGSGYYNRWLFSKRWGAKLGDANNV
jgi:GT2 family glycosyltransferase